MIEKKSFAYHIFKLVTKLIMNSMLYRKYILNGMNIDGLLVVVCSNYDMDKNCPYQLMTTGVYIIGYHIPISGGVFRYPIFESKYSKRKMKVLTSLKKKCTMNTLYQCGFPHLVVVNIMKYI